MQGIVRLFSQQFMGARADQDIRGFDADDHPVITALLHHADLVQSALHKPLRGDAAVFGDQFLFQRAAVDADPDGNLPLLGDIDNRFNFVAAADIAGIDADLVRAVFHGPDRHPVVKMDICHQGDMDPLLDLTDGQCSFFGGACAADDLTARLLQTKNLGNSGLHIFGGGIGHGLDQDRISSADHAVADADYFCMVTIGHFFLLFVCLF